MIQVISYLHVVYVANKKHVLYSGYVCKIITITILQKYAVNSDENILLLTLPRNL